jgi:UDP-glucose 4-epimerase
VDEMKVIVTGGAGFIGSNLVDGLIDDGHEVVIIDSMVNGLEENINPKAKMERCDIRDLNMDEIFKGVDVVFHLAALARVQPSIEDPLEFDSVNTYGTLNLLEHCRRNGVKRFVFSSSSSVYGDPPKRVLEGLEGLCEVSPLNPISPYALQKLVGEQYCQLYSKIHQMDTICLRYFNVYGERQRTDGAYKLVMGIFAEQKMNGEPLTIVGDGEQRRDFTYVRDVVKANKLAAESEFEGHYVFNVGNGENRSVNEIAALFGGETAQLPQRIEPKVTLADNEHIRMMLGWEPTMKVEDWIPKWKEEIGIG